MAHLRIDVLQRQQPPVNAFLFDDPAGIVANVFRQVLMTCIGDLQRRQERMRVGRRWRFVGQPAVDSIARLEWLVQNRQAIQRDHFAGIVLRADRRGSGSAQATAEHHGNEIKGVLAFHSRGDVSVGGCNEGLLPLVSNDIPPAPRYPTRAAKNAARQLWISDDWADNRQNRRIFRRWGHGVIAASDKTLRLAPGTNSVRC